MILKYALLFISLIYFSALYAQERQVEMADELRSSGKIYVVVAVLTAIFLGIVIYLVAIDKKVGKLEKEIKEKAR